MAQRQAPLPIILSLPHGGLATPDEVQGQLAITATTIYNECDLWVDQLFDFAHPELGQPGASEQGRGVLAQVHLPIARVLIDANRAPDDLANPDGPVKTQTSYGQPIYQSALTHAQQIDLRQRYWQPFHAELEQALQQQGKAAKLFLDGHNMAQLGPSAYGDPGQPRPLVCLANFGDAQGEIRPTLGWTSCEPALLRAAGELAAALFSDLTLLEPAGAAPPVVALNQPFHGGYILARYAQPMSGKPHLPGIMLEINRGLFVGNQQTDTPIQPPNQERIAAIRQRLYAWALRLVALLG